ncbi:class II peroxidase [Ramaria rubella]|nr:class II peroxidase [Ramaria rubella]
MLKLFPSLVCLAVATTCSGVNIKHVNCPDGVHVASDAACCPFFALRDDLQKNLFNNECGVDAREALRLSFLDAIAHSLSLKRLGKPHGGGADGSMLTFPCVEPYYAANSGISDIVDALLPFLASHPVSAGDLIQFAAAVGISNCVGAPRLHFKAGRPQAMSPAPEGLTPEPQDSVTEILARFADSGGFSPDEVVALLAAHSIAISDHVDSTIKDAPFDSTPYAFDTQIHLEMLLREREYLGSTNSTRDVASPLPFASGDLSGVLRLRSDYAIARDARTACQWQGFINKQTEMTRAFKVAMAKLAVVGQDTTDFVDCSEAVPVPVSTSVKHTTYPLSKTERDVEQFCKAPFPKLSASGSGSGSMLLQLISNKLIKAKERILKSRVGSIVLSTLQAQLRFM